MDFLSILGAGFAYLIGGFLIILLVATIIFRAATKLVVKQDTTFGMSIAIVLLGAIASIIAFGIPASIVFGLVGAPEIFVSILSFIISFSATSGVYMLMLKTNFWKASLIQIVMLLIVLLIVFLFALIFGGSSCGII